MKQDTCTIVDRIFCAVVYIFLQALPPNPSESTYAGIGNKSPFIFFICLHRIHGIGTAAKTGKALHKDLLHKCGVPHISRVVLAEIHPKTQQEPCRWKAAASHWRLHLCLSGYATIDGHILEQKYSSRSSRRYSTSMKIWSLRDIMACSAICDHLHL